MDEEKQFQIKWLSVQEIATRLGVSIGTIYKMCELKIIPHRRIGAGRGVFRISEEDFANYLAGSLIKATSPSASTTQPKET